MRNKLEKSLAGSIFSWFVVFFCAGGIIGHAPVCFGQVDSESRRQAEIERLQENFQWWPTDAQPSPVKDEKKGGYWWWPNTPGSAQPWGNRGYIYVYKIIFDYKSDELPEAKPQELRPSLLIKKILRNVKVYFDYNKSALRPDAVSLLERAVATLRRNQDANILITGNCDARGSEKYNFDLGRKRAQAVEQFMLKAGIDSSRVRIVSRGKLNAVAPVDDLVGMQKDRNAQFMIAEVEEVMIPAADISRRENIQQTEEGKFLVEEQEEVESEPKVTTREYIIQKNDSLWTIAEKELGKGYRWKYLYEFNKDRIKNPNRLRPGKTILIPEE